MLSSTLKFIRYVLLLSILLLAVPHKGYASEKLSITFAVDASGSMRGEKIRQIQESVSQISSSLETSGQFSLVTFSDEVEVLVSNTSDQNLIESALQSIKPAGKTSLYDGLKKSLEISPNSKSSVIIVFSDGEDNSSTISKLELPSQIDAFDGLVVLIGIGNSKLLLTQLNDIAGNKGKVFSILNLEELTDQINTIIKPTITSSLIVTKSKSQPDTQNYLQIAAVLLISTIILLISSWFLIDARSKQRLNKKLITAYDSEQTNLEEKSICFRLIRIPIFARYVAREERRLVAAGLKIDMKNWLYLQVAIFILLMLFLQTTGISPIFIILLAGFGGFGIGTLYLNTTRNRKASAFAEELPDVLTIIASSLQSGLSFTQALTSVARESDGEVALQFRRVLSEVQVGRNLIDSLQDVADRMNSQDFRWTISALTIQREIGGNLSEILSTTANTIRGRAEVRNEVKALSAEGRMSAYVLISIPLFMLLYLRLTRPDAFGLMFSTAPGLVMIAIVVILMLIGWIWVQKVVNIKL